MATLKITDIPEEVLTHNLLPLLQPNDVVRLRRVSQHFKKLADDHLRLHVRNKRILHIGECYNNGSERLYDLILMKGLLSLTCHLPVSQFSLCFNGDKINIFEDDNWKMKEFIETYGKQITHLTMSTMSTPMNNQKEIDFYEGLPNLTHLTIMWVRADGKIWKNDKQEEYIFPATFKNLKYLAIQSVVSIGRSDEVAVRKYFWNFVEFCANLETLVYPEFRNFNDVEKSVSLLFPHLGDLIGNGKLSELKSCDLNNVSENEISALGRPLAFANFCQTCNKFDVKLHLKGSLLKGLTKSVLKGVGHPVVSLKVWNIANLKATLPNLEYLELHTMSSRRINENPNGVGFLDPVWPNLNRLKYTWDIPFWINNSHRTFDRNFHILFETMRRPSVKSLELNFRCTLEHGDVPTPMLEKVAWSCFNLTTIKIYSWEGTNEQMSAFWRSLPLLEEICLSNCMELGDAAFIGEDVNAPIFLGLKNLKKLSLIDIHDMRDITDALFKLVIRHLHLREFNISSRKWGPLDSICPIYSVTQEGIKSLLTSNFAQSIERFPFNSWRLGDMSEREFLQLGKQFRSSQML